MRWKRPGSSIFTEDLAVSISYIKNFLYKNACPATVSDCEQNMRFLFYSQKFQVIKIFSLLRSTRSRVYSLIFAFFGMSGGVCGMR